MVGGGTTSYTTNALNQYECVGNKWYDYDDNGNLTYDVNFFYTYDAENHLTKVTRMQAATAP